MITVDSLTKRYGDLTVVDTVSFTCEPGTVTGFLGPNGAGKSTTMRMMTGLVAPSAGTSAFDGAAYRDLANPTAAIGTLLDPTAMHAGRTGRDTLTIAARMAGVPLTRVDELLDRVGLAGKAAGRRVGAYSLGMRQRLGIGQALIGSPSILMLDEPANGLDPDGIAWMRRLLRDFADQGGTVLLSSHLLGEVQATVDHLVVISGGKIVAAGAMDELLAGGGIYVRSPQRAELEVALASSRLGYRPDGADALVVTGDGLRTDDVARLAQHHGVLLTELRTAEDDLERFFFDLTQLPATAPVAA